VAVGDNVDVFVGRVVLDIDFDTLVLADTVGHAVLVLELVIVLVPVTDAVPVLVAVIVAVDVRVGTGVADWRVVLE
jgi:hypothetical protein